jgi:hypothetical protein
MTNNGISLPICSKRQNLEYLHMACLLIATGICLLPLVLGLSIHTIPGHYRGETGIEAAFSIVKEAELGYTLRWGKEIMFNLRRGEFCSHLGIVGAFS